MADKYIERLHSHIDVGLVRKNQRIINIKDLIGEVLSNLIKSSKNSTGSHSGDIRPSIFWTDSPPQKFCIGYLLCNGWTRPYLGYIETWEYVAFMTEWLDLDLEGCLKDMKNYENDVQACYDGGYQMCLGNGSEVISECLLVAGCFLCFALFTLQKIKNPNDIFHHSPSACAVYYKLSSKINEDPTRTKLDMLNPMNQIPMFVLKTIFTKSRLVHLHFDTNINRLVLSVFDDLYPRGDYHLELHDPRHVLEVIYSSRAREAEWQECVPKRIDELYIPNATELLGSATVFKKLDAGFCEVNFSNKLISAEMQITPMHIFPYTRELYTHLLNFEWKCRRIGMNKIPITSFLAIMKNLLQTTGDVKLLQKKGIVKNTLPGEEDVLTLVQDIWKLFGQEAIVGIPTELDNLSKKVIKHQESRFTVAYAGFKRQYCPSRWVAISIFAAFILFGLTIIQTIYTALGYYKA